MKKLIAILLSAALVLGLCASAFAKTDTSGKEKNGYSELFKELPEDSFAKELENITPLKLAKLIPGGFFKLVSGISTWEELLEALEAYTAASIYYLYELLDGEQYALGDRYLLLGSRGTDVVQLQSMLKDLGFYTDYIDGDFGSVTRAAVRVFQSIIGVPDTGLVDETTVFFLKGVFERIEKSDSARRVDYSNTEKMMQGLISHYTKTLNSLIKLHREKERAFGSRVMAKGDRGSDVAVLQTLLLECGYYFYEVDGVFGEETQKALKAFQFISGVKDTGTLNKETLEALSVFNIYAESIGNDDNFLFESVLRDNLETVLYLNALKDHEQIALGERQLDAGDFGSDVLELQWYLSENGFYIGKLDAYFGPKTVAAVTAYQADQGIVPTGSVDQETAESIKKYSLAAGTGEFDLKKTVEYYISEYANVLKSLIKLQDGPVIHFGQRELAEGDTGIDVVEMQQMLKGLGLYNVAVDGAYGPVTKQAVEDFQKETGVKATGAVDAETAEEIIKQTWKAFQSWYSGVEIMFERDDYHQLAAMLMPVTEIVSLFV